MRRIIITAFAYIFILFFVGSFITVFGLVSTASRLKSLVGLHEIEDIRQELFISIQKVSAYVYASNDVLASNLDELVRSGKIMHDSIKRCNDCHHREEVTKNLDETRHLINRFEAQFSYLITLEADYEWRKEQQEEVKQLSREILNRVNTMVREAGEVIGMRTTKIMRRMNHIYLIVGVSLIGTIIMALFVAHYLTRLIILPIQELVNSTRRISEGEWGYESNFQASGEFQELITVFNQMSQSLAHEREQEEVHNQKLQETQRQLVEAEKLTALGTMAGGIAHDFNNILCGIIGHVSLLAEQVPKEKALLDTIHRIEKAGFRASDLIKQLLTFARQKTVLQQNVDLNVRIKDVVFLLEKTLDKRIRVKIDLYREIPEVLGDPSQLEQIVMNLCVNARDAMTDGGVLTISSGVFEPDREFCQQHPDAQQREYVQMTVKDTGSGIGEEVLPRIFDPFFTTKESGKGTGLGLAMVYGIVQSHDGFCTIESSLGQGTTINIYIPTIETQTIKTELTAVSASPTDKTILIVDDEPMIVLALKEHLEKHGCKTFTAENGKIAVDIFEERKDEIDLIILDINMPVMCGRDAYHNFIKIKPDIKVLISTGYIMTEDTKELLEMGAGGFLQKPYTMREIDRKIQTIFMQEKDN